VRAKTRKDAGKTVGAGKKKLRRWEARVRKWNELGPSKKKKREKKKKALLETGVAHAL